MQSQDMTWSDYMALLRRRWRPTFAVTAFIALGSIYVAYALPAVYESSATILIEQQGIPTDFVQATVNTYAEERLQTIYQRVLAASQVLELIEKHDLYPDERRSQPDEALVLLFRDSTEMLPQNVTTLHDRTGREAIVTFGFQLFYRYSDPVKARDIAAELSDLFVSNNSLLRSEAANRTTAFLDTEVEALETKLASVAERIAAFKEQHVRNLPEDQAVNLGTWERLRTDLTQVEAQLRETRERKAILESEIVDTPRYRPVMDESGEPVLGGVDRLAEAQQELIRLRGRYSEDHPAIINLRREVAALSSSTTNLANLAQQLHTDLQARQQELSSAREEYSENHPDVIRLQRTVRAIQEQIADVENEMATSGSANSVQPNNPVYIQLQTRISSAETELADLVRRRDDLAARIGDLDQRRLEAPQVERQFTKLMNEQEVLQTRYRQLRGLEGEAALGQALESGQSAERLTVIEPPRVPSSPVSPNRVSLSFLGIVLAIAIGLGVASLTEAADTKVRGQRDIYQLLEMPPIGIIPYVEDAPDKLRRRTFNATMSVAFIGAVAFVVITVIA